MTVQQLIDQLNKVEDKSIPVIMGSSNFELNGSWVEVKSAMEFVNTKKVSTTYTDRFDYTDYDVKVFINSPQGSNALFLSET